MSAIVGGLRSRLVSDSLFNMVHDSLEALGWFDSDRQHAPVSFRDEPVGLNEEVPLNTVAFEPGTVVDEDAEMGSNLTDDEWTYYIDVYGESRDIGMHLANDIRDILRGKIPSIGRGFPVLDVYDYRQATPFVIFGVYLSRVRVDLAHNWPQLWRQHWYSLSFRIEDSYSDDEEGELVPSGLLTPGPHLFPAG